MNKKPLIFVAFFVLCVGFVIYAEYQGLLGSAALPEPSLKTEGRPENTGISGESEQPAEENKGKKSWLKDIFMSVQDYEPANQELQTYVNGQVEMKKSRIRLTADLMNGRYLSGKVESQKAFRYGKFKFRVNTIEGKGLFPAVWMLPAEGGSYPEIDIYEMIGSYPDEIYGVMHYYKNGDKERNFFEYKFKEDVPEEYVIGFEWAPEKMVWTLNGEELYRIEENIPDMPMYMIMNLAIGGKWPGHPTEKTKFPSTFKVEVLKYEPEEVFERQ